MESNDAQEQRDTPIRQTRTASERKQKNLDNFTQRTKGRTHRTRARPFSSTPTKDHSHAKYVSPRPHVSPQHLMGLEMCTYEEPSKHPTYIHMEPCPIRMQSRTPFAVTGHPRLQETRDPPSKTSSTKKTLTNNNRTTGRQGANPFYYNEYRHAKHTRTHTHTRCI